MATTLLAIHPKLGRPRSYGVYTCALDNNIRSQRGIIRAGFEKKGTATLLNVLGQKRNGNLDPNLRDRASQATKDDMSYPGSERG
jgi:hypothetical protein